MATKGSRVVCATPPHTRVACRVWAEGAASTSRALRTGWLPPGGWWPTPLAPAYTWPPSPRSGATVWATKWLCTGHFYLHLESSHLMHSRARLSRLGHLDCVLTAMFAANRHACEARTQTFASQSYHDLAEGATRFRKNRWKPVLPSRGRTNQILLEFFAFAQRFFLTSLFS